jgi:hypothetical protein
VESEKGKALHKRSVEELFERFEMVAPGITRVLN